MNNRTNIFPYCIYTIRHTRELEVVNQNGRAGAFTENRHWTTGLELLRQAQEAHQRMAVLFAPADSIDGLIFYAWLTEIHLQDDNGTETTKYSFEKLTPILHRPSRNTLRLLRTGKQLSERYIRPYAICFTPEFLKLSETIAADLEAVLVEEEPLPDKDIFEGGSPKKRLTTYYERNPELRAAAILHHGTQSVFGKSFDRNDYNTQDMGYTYG